MGYEQARSDPSQTERRRPRLRLVDLSAKSLSELRHFAHFLGVDCTGCIEKSDLVNRIATSGTVEIIRESSEEEHPPSMDNTLALTHLEKMTIREIKAEMARLGVDQSGCLEKRDLIERLMLARNMGTGQGPA